MNNNLFNQIKEIQQMKNKTKYHNPQSQAGEIILEHPVYTLCNFITTL